MARSVFYYHRKKLLNADDKYKCEKEEIIRIYHLHKGRYGYRRITTEMRNSGYKINHKTVQKLMGILDLKCRIRKVRYRSYRGVVGRIAPNVLERDFKASLPNQKWATDVTQINIKGEKIFFSPILDMFNGEIIAYSISKTPNLQMINEMLDKAFDKVRNTKGLIFHSDQGWQYQHYGYRKALEDHGIIQSMSRKGNCLDNAMAENFFGIMKSELLYAENFETVDNFVKSLKQYIDYYNKQRIKSRLDGKSPVQYRAQYKYS
jgi:Transposase and inactivated derivatives